MSRSDRELAASDIQSWMNKPVDASHPFYAIYWLIQIERGHGIKHYRSKNNLTSTGVNLQWTYDRGRTDADVH